MTAVCEETIAAFENVAGPILKSQISIVRSPFGHPMLVTEPAMPSGVSLIFLNTEPYRWCQIAYQLAHELGHIITNAEGPTRNRRFTWIEETLCELASVMTLRQLQTRWATSTNVNWASYSGEFSKYVTELLGTWRSYVGPTPLPEWIVQEEASLAADPIQRMKNAKVALAWLPIFERRHEEAWRAARRLNYWTTHEGSSIRDFFLGWQSNAANERHVVVELSSAIGLM